MPSGPLLERLATGLADRYEVRSEVGRGGMATVYLARDIRHDRFVALKVLSPDIGAGVSSERFLSEIKTSANLSHPHILPLFDSGETDGLLFYVMPYVEGETLQDRIASVGQFSLDEAHRVIREIGDGLAYAHRNGLVHRDVKPSNVLLSDGHALLADFGIAKAIDSEETTALTATGMALGTPLYMSPEQGTGSHEMDHRSDLYSLACIYYEMLVGNPPYSGPNPLAVLAAHSFNDIPSTLLARSDVPDWVDVAITRGMAKEPEDRFGSIEEFLKALTHPDAHTSQERLIGRREEPKGEKGRWMGYRALGAIILLATAGVTASVVRSGGGPGTSLDILAPQRVVVAPLDNRTGDPSLDEIGRMGADWITEGLHRTGVVDVVPSLSALQAAAFVRDLMTRSDSVDPIRALGVETGAGKVISGSYYLEGDSLLYQMQVTDAETGGLIDALDLILGSVSSPRTAIGELRNRVMGSLSVNFDDRLSGVDLSSVQPPRYESYQAFDRGMTAYLQSDWEASIAPFNEAFELDSTFVIPLLYSSFSSSNLGQMTSVDSLSSLLQERRDELSEYHRNWLDYLIARARGRNQDALVAIREAARLAPGSKAVYNYAYAAQLTNRPQEAIEALHSLDPERGPMRGWFSYWTLMTDNLHRLGLHREELEAARRAGELYPDRRWVARMEGEALAALGRTREVLRLMEELGAFSEDGISPGEVMNAVAEELRFHGHTQEAEELFLLGLAWYEGSSESGMEARSFREGYWAILQNLGRIPEAMGLVETLLNDYPNDLDALAWKGTLEARLGNEPEANRISIVLEEEERSDPHSRGRYTLPRARIAAILNRPEEATALLQASFTQGFRPLRHPDINLESLSGYPPFEAVMTPKDR